MLFTPLFLVRNLLRLPKSEMYNFPFLRGDDYESDYEKETEYGLVFPFFLAISFHPAYLMDSQLSSGIGDGCPERQP